MYSETVHVQTLLTKSRGQKTIVSVVAPKTKNIEYSDRKSIYNICSYHMRFSHFMYKMSVNITVFCTCHV